MTLGLFDIIHYNYGTAIASCRYDFSDVRFIPLYTSFNFVMSLKNNNNNNTNNANNSSSRIVLNAGVFFGIDFIEYTYFRTFFKI